jgi:serine protease DegQ
VVLDLSHDQAPDLGYARKIRIDRRSHLVLTHSAYARSMKKAIALIVAVVVSLAIYGWSVVALSNEDETNPNQAAVQTVDLDQSDERPPLSETAEIVEKVLPSVVNVQITAERFDPFTGPTEAQGQGSGVVIDSEGVILTNFHVVRDATDVQIALSDGRELAGTVLGAAPERDLAVVKVDADDLDPIELGKSSSLRLGDDVIAVGFPLGLSGGATVTKGIVSSTFRTIEPEGGVELRGVLQTDAAINPGNSGGALVDANGRLVGINTAAAGAAAAENVGFAISIDAAIPVVKEILNEPAEERAWMGVDIQDLTPELAQQLDLSITEGVLVAGTFDGSPAEAAGINPGDVIVSIDGAEISDIVALAAALQDLGPGDEIEIMLANSDGERTVNLTLDQRPPEFLPLD